MYIRSKKLSKIGHAVSENLRGQNHVRKIEKYILKKRGGGFSWKKIEKTLLSIFSLKNDKDFSG